jgi:hypothetical protein
MLTEAIPRRDHRLGLQAVVPTKVALEVLDPAGGSHLEKPLADLEPRAAPQDSARGTGRQDPSVSPTALAPPRPIVRRCSFHSRCNACPAVRPLLVEVDHALREHDIRPVVSALVAEDRNQSRLRREAARRHTAFARHGRYESPYTTENTSSTNPRSDANLSAPAVPRRSPSSSEYRTLKRHRAPSPTTDWT